jgi:hypothetical protein
VRAQARAQVLRQLALFKNSQHRFVCLHKRVRHKRTSLGQHYHRDIHHSSTRGASYSNTVLCKKSESKNGVFDHSSRFIHSIFAASFHEQNRISAKRKFNRINGLSAFEK